MFLWQYVLGLLSISTSRYCYSTNGAVVFQQWSLCPSQLQRPQLLYLNILYVYSNSGGNSTSDDIDLSVLTTAPLPAPTP